MLIRFTIGEMLKGSCMATQGTIEMIMADIIIHTQTKKYMKIIGKEFLNEKNKI